ncbi:Septum formation [Curtobacterium sp. UNCCL20]|uniref:septum formation family protein n=1 Tax=Curtobacterium sp. UNCCL20 TaxID=1502773 RepID=UPI00088F3080|nr:septum formation family protein [Curtobacterium sp. UNCCL20]SDQ27431.1 Septum formation [Curtobacterium sp. UNCCL20]
MTPERPDDAHEPDQAAGPEDGDDSLEARRGSAPDAPFHGLRSAADIFGAPRGEDEWPSRRDRREAERTARETGAPLPEPFEPVASAPGAPEADETTDVPEPAAPREPADADATQAISMPEQLTEPSENPQASAEHERATLGERIPPAAPVPPTSSAPHPSSISLPTAQAHRDARAAENRAIEDERRRLDPFGEGRSDVDWLGRATGSHPESSGPGVPPAIVPPPAVPPAIVPPPAVPPALGVENVLPAADEPPSFTELLRIADADTEGTGGHERPFDWAIRDDEASEVPTTLTTDAFDTTALAGGAWTRADESDDDVVSGEVETPVHGTPAVPAAGDVTGALAATTAPDATGVDDERDEADAAARLQADPSDAATTALPVAGTPWWAEPDATVPPTAAPPLVEPAAGGPDAPGYPAHLPPAVGQDLDAVMGIRGHAPDDTELAPEPLPAAAPDDLDQSEWDGRETSDTSAIKDLFGTEAVGQLGGTGYDPHDTGTQMMPAVGAAPAHAPAPGRTPYTAPAAPVPPAAAAAGAAGAAGAGAGAAPGGGERDNFINEGFAKLRNEGRRGKLLLIWGSVALIVILLVAVFALTRWILGNTIEDHTPAPTSTSAASAKASPSTAASSAPATTPSPSSLATLQFATTPAAPGEHSWTELAGGECLSPFTNAWAQTFTVVDCATPHIAQLTARLPVSANQWPGPDALAAQAAEQCQTSAALNTSAAAAFGDVQVQGSYAPDQATWDQGDTFISCFVTRSSGDTLTGSVAP